MAYFSRLRRMAGPAPALRQRGDDVDSPRSAPASLERHEIRQAGAGVSPPPAPAADEPPSQEPRVPDSVEPGAMMAPAAPREGDVGEAEASTPTRWQEEPAPSAERGTRLADSTVTLDEHSSKAVEVSEDSVFEAETARRGAPAIVEVLDEVVSGGESPLVADSAKPAGAMADRDDRSPDRKLGHGEPTPGAPSEAETPVERFQEALVRVREWMTPPPAEIAADPSRCERFTESEASLVLVAPAVVAPAPGPPAHGEPRVARPFVAAEQPIEVSIGAIQVSVQEPAPADRKPTAARNVQPGSRFSPSRYYLRG